ncbi:hypothetical protein BA746_02160 [Vibrio parahaemolyticus]|nr:hypothetical protein ACX04_00210 [Vibrio parahaemolyticus]OAR38591.1 hypothetical protein EM79_019445 [Vibrio parahaemolyticus]ODW90665.1 hypothetical protein BBM90_18965 [Vibrio parahaemolyticus]ODX52524.1 hypothetical protein BBM06_03590 [Vibrio parahaemolyticus]ODX56110.1 hypothetical protein BBM07_18385 [Vibrio parahaemolyticus]
MCLVGIGATKIVTKKETRLKRKKMARVHLRSKRARLERLRARLIPRVRHIDGFNKETFESYYSRWHKSLKNIPMCVVEQWAYEHNDEFIEYWSKLLPRKWKFHLKGLTTEQVMSIQMLEHNRKNYEHAGLVCIEQKYARTRLSNYMFDNCTFPRPIIVFEKNEALIHPRSYGEIAFDRDFNLAEGHTRLGLFRAMHSRNSFFIENHDVWVIETNT